MRRSRSQSGVYSTRALSKPSGDHKRPQGSPTARLRTQSGIYLIEVLVALILGSLMMLALLALYLTTLRVTTATSNQLIADQIGHSILDYARTGAMSNYAPITNQPLIINTTGSFPAPSPSVPQNAPVGLDEFTYTWQPSTVSGAFTGTAQVSTAAGSSGTSAYTTVTVTVTWTDSQKMIAHTSTYSTNIYSNEQI